MNYKVGDIVYLKSGSNAMTVTDEIEGGIEVAFWDAQGFQKRLLPPESLTKDHPLAQKIDMSAANREELARTERSAP
jgi:uncharacterized protein YodC (DUF2158 family)